MLLQCTLEEGGAQVHKKEDQGDDEDYHHNEDHHNENEEDVDYEDLETFDEYERDLTLLIPPGQDVTSFFLDMEKGNILDIDYTVLKHTTQLIISALGRPKWNFKNAPWSNFSNQSFYRCYLRQATGEPYP